MPDESTEPLRPEDVCAFFSAPEAVAHYTDATVQIGLWRSEEKVFRQVFAPDDTLLDLGCGAGRIALGLQELGYRNVIGVDFSQAMVKAARHQARLLEVPVPFRREDARALSFADGLFDGVIFGFNGLMQIPGAADRLQAAREVGRVLRPGGHFVFTTHDRDEPRLRKFLETQHQWWSSGEPPPQLHEFGDNLFDSGNGMVFMHLPDRKEVLHLLEEAGLTHLFDAMRAEIANEPNDVRAFSDSCRFWIAQKNA